MLFASYCHSLKRLAMAVFSFLAMVAGAQSRSTVVVSLPEASGAVSESSSSSSGDALPETPAVTPRTATTKHHVETTVSLGAFASLTPTRLQNGSHGELATESASPAAGALGTFRQSFTPWLGYSVNMGFTRTTLHYTNGASYGSAGTAANYYTPADQYELSLSYVAQKHITPRLTGFFDLGAGMQSFLPENRGAKPLGTPLYETPPVTFRPLGVGGLGVDYHFSPALALRAEYRGLLSKYPDFAGVGPRLISVSSQPTVSVTYTFGAKKKEKNKRPAFY
jgi:hypothetical protein